jgi:hypothetical protein
MMNAVDRCVFWAASAISSAIADGSSIEAALALGGTRRDYHAAGATMTPAGAAITAPACR